MSSAFVYEDFLRHVLAHGDHKSDRTGTGTVSVFGGQLRFDLQQGFPLITTKKVHLKSIVYELLWFLRGETNTAYLKENGVSIWDEWANEKGELGPVYGKQWRSWEGANGVEIDQVKDLIDQIKKNPKEESNYLNLILLYSKNNENEKSLEVAKQLAKEIPNSEWGQVSLFKTYLDSNQADKAIKSMNTILASSKIDSKIKHRTLNEFLLYVNKNPQYAPDLEKAISYFDNDPNVDVAKEIGKFYHSKGQFENAIKYYEKDLKANSDTDRETNLLLLEAYSKAKQFEPLTKRAMTMIEVYPSQPQFYYYAGLGNNQLKQFKNAKWSAGPQYLFLNSKINLPDFNLPPPFVDPKDIRSTISQLGAAIQFDGRDNIFTPDKGIRLQSDFFWSDNILGSDYDAWRVNLSAIGFYPLSKKLIGLSSFPKKSRIPVLKFLFNRFLLFIYLFLIGMSANRYTF